MKLQNIFILALILVVFPVSHAFAHKVIIFAWVENGIIHTESSFGSKRKAKDCVITVVDEKGLVVHEGQTDADGNHSFNIPENIDSDLILTLEAGIGHQAQWRIPKGELLTLPSVKDVQTAMKEKEKMEKGPSVFKILGGIGIIFSAGPGNKVFQKETFTEMIQEKFAYGHSFIHQLDPKIRILASIVLSVTTALCDNLYLLGIYFVISIGLITMAGLNRMDVVKRLKPLFWFLLMIWIILPLTFDGETMVQLYGVRLTGPGVMLCCTISIKSITILLIFTALIATMTIASLGNGLHRIHVPDKMVFLLLMSYRYISVIEAEYTRLLRAAKFRGFRPGTNLHSYKTFAYLAGMLFVRASVRAERVYQAMLCRGFNQKFHTLDVYPSNRLNSKFLMGISVASITLVIIEIIWV